MFSIRSAETVGRAGRAGRAGRLRRDPLENTPEFQNLAAVVG